MGAHEPAPEPTTRIVKHLDADPRYNATVHETPAILWVKFPHDQKYDQSITGQYVPEQKNASTASWLYTHNLGFLYNELKKSPVF